MKFITFWISRLNETCGGASEKKVVRSGEAGIEDRKIQDGMHLNLAYPCIVRSIIYQKCMYMAFQLRHISMGVHGHHSFQIAFWVVLVSLLFWLCTGDGRMDRRAESIRAYLQHMLIN